MNIFTLAVFVVFLRQEVRNMNKTYGTIDVSFKCFSVKNKLDLITKIRCILYGKTNMFTWSAAWNIHRKLSHQHNFMVLPWLIDRNKYDN